MIFSLEALQAGKGDCLVLHFGPPAAPRFIVIDGGPAGAYDNALRPRLESLARRWANPGDDKLHLDMLMVSHIDDDHIHGILDWMEEAGRDAAPPCNFATLWYNSFDSIFGGAAKELQAKAASLGDAGGLVEDATARVLAASVAQGRELRERADAMGVPLNGGFEGLVMCKETGRTTVTRGAGLKLHVVAPGLDRLTALKKEWDKHVRDNPDPVVTAAFADRSVSNLSSIAVVAELGARRMLLTGDARGDDLLAGLEKGGFLDANGKAHLNLIKMPHHGSNRNMTRQWLERITADHYVFSANGEHGNPDPETVKWLCEARANAGFTVWFTNEDMVDPKGNQPVGKMVKDVLAAHPNRQRRVVFRPKPALSVVADLGDPVAY